MKGLRGQRLAGRHVCAVVHLGHRLGRRGRTARPHGEDHQAGCRDWANQYLGEKSYAIVYKREGEDRNVQKIAAPKITPIVTNRDMQSAFLTEIQQSKVKPLIEPVFVDYQKEMAQFDLRDGIHVPLQEERTERHLHAQLHLRHRHGERSLPLAGLRLHELPRNRGHECRADRFGDVRHRLHLLDACRQQPELHLDFGSEREHAAGDGDCRGADFGSRGRRGDSSKTSSRT